jgi:CRISPR-associated protein (Cas_Cas02710)
MNTILLFSVGGSHQPIVRSIQQNKPHLVHFLCSADIPNTKGSYTQVMGEGKVLKSNPNLEHPDLPNIVTLTGLNEGQFGVHRIQGFDNLNECYLAALQLIEQVHAEHPNARVIVDYTGGTKSMTAGLAAAALDDGRCEIQLVTGLRQDLRQVTDQTEFVRPVHVWDMQATRRMRAARDLMARFDYSGAASILEEAAARFASDTTMATLQRWLSLCRAFDAWDRFDHVTARRLIQPYRNAFVPYAIFLDAVVEGKGAHGFEWVEDLLLNAQRRAVQRRFDDAVGRFYRTVELTAQVWLRQRHGIDTGKVEISLIPDTMKAKVEKESNADSNIKVGLLIAWDVIAAFGDDPLGACFHAERAMLLDFLNVRNQSLFAHGATPIVERDYQRHAPRVQVFVQKAVDSGIAALGKKRVKALQQLPTEWE